jgi:hypothetical protein
VSYLFTVLTTEVRQGFHRFVHEHGYHRDRHVPSSCARIRAAPH